MFFEAFPDFVTLLNQIELLKEVHMGTLSLVVFFFQANGFQSSFLLYLNSAGDPRTTLLCQFLSRVCTIDLLRLPELPKLLSQLRNSCELHSDDINSDNLLQICVFVFTAANGTALLKEQQLELLASLAHALNGTSSNGDPNALEPWVVYQLACKASVYRQPRFAADLFEQLASLVSCSFEFMVFELYITCFFQAITLKNIYWLRGLAKLNQAQADLYDCVSDLFQTERWVPRLSAAISTASREITEAQYLLAVCR